MNEVMKQRIVSGLINNSFSQTLMGNFKTKIADAIVQHAIDKTVNFIAKEITVTMNISKGGYYLDDNQTYKNFLVWLHENTNPSSNKSFSPEDNSNGISDLGDKPVYFKYKKHHFIVYKKLSSSSNYTQLIITMLGRDVSIMKSLYDEIRPKIDNSKVNIFTSQFGGGWSYLSNVPKRNLDTVVIKNETKQAIIDRIEDWKNSEEWYKERGISYKLSMIFYGPPGTGKTSLIKAIASDLGYHVYLLNLKHYSDTSLVDAISNTSNNSIIVLEDFDSHDVVQARSTKLKTTGYEGYEEDEDYDIDENSMQVRPARRSDEKLTLTGVLNALDGIVPIDNKIIIMTTNTLENIDSALTRKGRVDAKFFIDLMDDKEVREYIKLMFPEKVIDENIIFSKIAGCDLQDIYFENKFDFDGFIDAIPKKAT